MIFPASHHDFQSADDTAVIHTCPEGQPSSQASNSCKHTAAAGRSMCGRIWKQNADQVSCRAGHQETGVDTESVATTIFCSQSKGKRDRDSKGIISKKSMNGKLTRPYEGSYSPSKKFFDAEAEVGARNWKREILTSPFTRLIRNLNLRDFSYMKQLDGWIKLKETKLACMVNWMREICSSKNIMQRIAKKLRN